MLNNFTTEEGELAYENIFLYYAFPSCFVFGSKVTVSSMAVGFNFCCCY